MKDKNRTLEIKNLKAKDVEAIYGKFVVLDCNSITGQNIIFNNASFTNINVSNFSYSSIILDSSTIVNLSVSNLTATNISALNISVSNFLSQNATITNLNLENTFISNISITETTQNEIPFVRYDIINKELLYKFNHYGEFLSTETQIASANDTVLLTYNQSTTYGVYINPSTPSQIIIAQPGVYKIGTSIQFDKTESSGSKAQCYFWFKKDGNNIDNSTTAVFIPGKNEMRIC